MSSSTSVYKKKKAKGSLYRLYLPPPATPLLQTFIENIPSPRSVPRTAANCNCSSTYVHARRAASRSTAVAAPRNGIFESLPLSEVSRCARSPRAVRVSFSRARAASGLEVLNIVVVFLRVFRSRFATPPLPPSNTAVSSREMMLETKSFERNCRGSY